jgi:pimeloyl-ACP methyl ester carboxylesterase
VPEAGLIVLLPGLGLSGAVWRDIAPVLAVEGPVEVLELDLGGGAALAAVAERAVAALRDRGPVHLVGQSYGATVALHLAERLDVRSVTAFAPVGFWTARERAASSALLRTTSALVAATPARVLDRAVRTPAGRRALLAAFAGRPSTVPPDVARRALADYAARAHDVRRATAQFAAVTLPPPPRVPLTIAWGSRDAVTPAHQAGRARDWNPSAHHVRLVGAGHVPMWTHRADVLDAIDASTGSSGSSTRVWSGPADRPDRAWPPAGTGAPPP